MGTAQVFARELKVAGAGLEPEALRLKLAGVAKQALAELIESGEGSPDYIRVVNGQISGREENVKLPGPIIYEFSWLRDVAEYALAFLRNRWKVRGPSKGGHYVESFFILGGGKQIKLDDVSNYPEIMITNDQPYARKVQLGQKGFEIPAGIFNDCEEAVRKQFNNKLVETDVKFILLSGGYVPRRKQKGRRTGEPVRYPALVLKMRH